MGVIHGSLTFPINLEGIGFVGPEYLDSLFVVEHVVIRPAVGCTDIVVTGRLVDVQQFGLD